VLHAALAWSFWSAQDFPRGFRDEFFIVELTTDIVFGGDLRALFLGDYYPPLQRLPGVLALAAGAGYRGMLAAQALLWLPLLVFGTWWSARRLTGEWGATLAVALLLPAAGILDSLHRFEPNLGATAAAAGCLAAFLWSDGLQKRREVLLLTVCLGLGLMVDRLGTLPCVALPLGWAAFRGRKNPVVRRNVLLLCVALVVAVGWWYALFIRDYVGEWLPQLLAGEVDRSGEVLEARPPLVFWALHYLWIWIDSQVGLLGGVLFLGGLAWGVRHRGEKAVGEVLLWLVLGLTLFSLIPKRQPFYTLPLLPAAAVLAAAMLVGITGRATASLGLSRLFLASGAALLVTLPAVLTARPGQDLDPGVVAWTLQNRSPLPERWVGERFPLGQRPDGRRLDIASFADRLEGVGVPTSAPVVVLSTDGQISESQLLSILRIERRSSEVFGVVVHPETVAERGAEFAALIDLRSASGWPDDEAVIDAHERRFGWEQNEELLAVMREMKQRFGEASQPYPVGESTLQIWVQRPR